MAVPARLRARWRQLLARRRAVVVVVDMHCLLLILLSRKFTGADSSEVTGDGRVH